MIVSVGQNMFKCTPQQGAEASGKFLVRPLSLWGIVGPPFGLALTSIADQAPTLAEHTSFMSSGSCC